MDLFSYGGISVYRSIYAPVNSNMFVMLTGTEAVVFDPNENEKLLILFKEKGIEKAYILLTHGHYDHICGVEWLKDNITADVYCQERCAVRLANSKRPVSRLVALILATEDKKDGGHRYQDFKESYKPFTVIANKTFDKRDEFTIGEYVFKVTYTPGHSEGSACYEVKRKDSDGKWQFVFTGDTLLQDDVAITRFPGGNTSDYKNIALPYLQSLDKNLIVMPGHGDPFVLGESKFL